MITIDQPRSADGTDKGMDPVELLSVSIASCAAYFAMAFLRRRILDLTGLEVECDWEYAEDPHRVGTIDLKVVLPADLPDREKEGLLRTVEHCTVKNTLEYPPANKSDNFVCLRLSVDSVSESLVPDRAGFQLPVIFVMMFRTVSTLATMFI